LKVFAEVFLEAVGSQDAERLAKHSLTMLTTEATAATLGVALAASFGAKGATTEQHCHPIGDRLSNLEARSSCSGKWERLAR